MLMSMQLFGGNPFLKVSCEIRLGDEFEGKAKKTTC